MASDMGSGVFLGSIDQGTTSTRFCLFDTDGRMVEHHQVEHDQHYPKPGWCEHDPMDIIRNTRICIDKAVAKFLSKGHTISSIKGVGITNQRETTVVWSRSTGKPLHNAVVWLDTRTKELVEEFTARHGKGALAERTGLPFSTYFSGFKLLWLIRNVKEVQDAIARGDCMFGTIDCWLLWNLTGGVNGGVHATDVTNASRTILMDLRTLQWDQEILDMFGIPATVLPQIRSSSEVYGQLVDTALKGAPIAGIAGDQQAALIGQLCFKKGDAKNTYGTGCFMLLNTGTAPVVSKHGLLTTVGYKFGDRPAHYALEGSIAIAGVLMQWMRDNVGFFESSSEIEAIAKSVADSGGVYFVPAFSGLFAPHWREDARGLVVGLTLQSTKAHIVRAGLESCCYQTYDVLKAMRQDGGTLSRLKVDGGMTANRLLLQTQADVLGVDVVKPDMAETTALGSAYAAGLAVGVWAAESDIVKEGGEVMYSPAIAEAERAARLAKWDDAVKRTLNWV